MGTRFSDSDLRDRFEGAERFIRGLGRAVPQQGDAPDLAHLLSLRDDIDAAMRAACEGLLKQGHTWVTIGHALGVTRASARQRWGLG